MKILMLSWRDMLHPKKGGAEIVTDIYLNALSKKGHEVTLFSAEFNGSSKQEIYNNYKIIRKGNQLTVHYYGLLYAKNNQKDLDIIIDQVNTIPFFTPLFIKKQKRVAFFHQLCMNIWFYETKFPISIIGNISERIYLKFYRNTRAFVVSESTKQDIIKHCKSKSKNILVLPNHIDFKPINEPKEKEDYFLYVGRLTKSKRVHHIIKAIYLSKKKMKQDMINNRKFGKTILTQIFNKNIGNVYNNEGGGESERGYHKGYSELQRQKMMNLKETSSQSLLNPQFNQTQPKPHPLSFNNINKEIFNPFPKLIIIGTGNEKYKNKLKQQINKLNLNNQVKFTGSISNQERNNLMQKAQAIIVTSVKEGWGLIVTEANANGTIAITYNTDGLRDANTKETGIITKNNNPKEIASHINIITYNPELRKEKEAKAIEFAKEHSNWEKNTRRLEEWIMR
jgi:glycosyltransferase involved in cell wall biosynthesis